MFPRPKPQRAGTLVFVLAFGEFGIINTEMGVTGILPQVAREYGVSTATAGLLVSMFALVVAVAGPTLPLLLARARYGTPQCTH